MRSLQFSQVVKLKFRLNTMEKNLHVDYDKTYTSKEYKIYFKIVDDHL